MGIKLRINNQDYDNVLDIQVERSMENMSGRFNAVLTLDTIGTLPFSLSGPDSQNNEGVQVLVDDNVVLTGYIYAFNSTVQNRKHIVSITGRDTTADFIDSSILKPFSFKSKAKLVDIISNVLKDNGMKVVSGPVNPKNIFTSGAPTIGVIDLVNPDEFKEDDIIGSEVGESISDFINKYAAKRQVFVNADGKGNIVIDRGATELLPTKLIYRKLSPGSIKSAINTRENNMLSVSLDRSYEDRFNKYVVLTQKNPNALLETGSAVSASEVVEQKGSATDSTMRTSRTFVILDDSDSKETADKRAIWEANIRRARSLNYSCDVQGYKISSDSDVIWSPNKLVIVEDEINSISSQMLIKSVTYSFNENGSITTLNLGYPDSFTLQAEQTVRESRTNKIDTEGLL